MTLIAVLCPKLHNEICAFRGAHPETRGAHPGPDSDSSGLMRRRRGRLHHPPVATAPHLPFIC